MSAILDIGLLAAGLRMAVPILLAGLGGLFTDRVNIFNVGLEGMMLVGAFAAVAGSYWSGSAWVGLAAAVGAGLLLAGLFALFAIKLKTDPILTGIALNFFASGATVIALQALFGTRGSFGSGRTALLPRIELPFLDAVPLLGRLLGGNNLLFYLAFLAAPLLWVVFNHTRAGLRIRAVGEFPGAAEAVGVRPAAYQWISVLMSGALSGIGGAYLSLSALGLFSENMTSGRGFIALAAIFFGRSKPLGILLAALFFGIAESTAIRLQGLGAPSRLVLMVPYVAAVISLVLAAPGWRRSGRQ